MEIAYQKIRIKGFLNKNLIFLLFNQSIVQITKDIESPPIQAPEIKSLIPKYRQSPTPAPTATVQTGQTASLTLESNNPKIKNPNNNSFLSILAKH